MGNTKSADIALVKKPKNFVEPVFFEEVPELITYCTGNKISGINYYHCFGLERIMFKAANPGYDSDVIFQTVVDSNIRERDRDIAHHITGLMEGKEKRSDIYRIALKFKEKCDALSAEKKPDSKPVDNTQ